jgi:hypothetical protein
MIIAIMATAMGINSVYAIDTETDVIPIIGKTQVVGFDGTGDNQFLDGTLVSTAFGGPEGIAPPGLDPATGVNFAANFTFDAVNNVYVPTSVFTTSRKFPADIAVLQNTWVYAFVIINDEGSDANEGGASIRQAGVAVSLNLSNPAIVPDPFITVDGGTRGNYVYAYGETNQGGGRIKTDSLMMDLGEYVIDYTSTLIQPAAESEIIFYYSPFAPSNGNASMKGLIGETLQSHTTKPRHHVARWWPVFSCAYSDFNPDPVDAGGTTTGTLTITNTANSRDNVPSPGQDLPGFQLKKLNGEFPSDYVNVTVTSPDEDAGCITITSVTPVLVTGPLGAVTDTLALVERDNSAPLTVTVDVDEDICSNPECDTTIDLLTVLEAQSPYDFDPPFEGLPGEPDFDADPLPGGTFACSGSFDINCPCEHELVKKVIFVDETLPEPPCNSTTGFDSDDAPRCGKVKVLLTLSNPITNTDPITVTSFSDDLPAGLNFIPGTVTSVPAGVTGSEAGGVVTFSNFPGPIAPNSSLTICFLARVSDTASGSLLNQGMATSECANGNPAEPDPAIDTATVNVKIPQLDVTVQQPGNRVCPEATQTQVVFRVCNPSPAGTGWPIVVNIPQANTGCLNFVSQDVTGSRTLDPGQCVDVTVTVGFNPACGSGPKPVSLNVTGRPEGVTVDDCDLTDGATTDILVVLPSVTISCDADKSFLIPDGIDQAVFTVTVTNNGSSVLENLILDGCELDPGLTLVSSTPLAPTTLNPGDSAFATYTVTAVPGTFGEVCLRNCSVSGHPAELPDGDTVCDVSALSNPCCVFTEELEIPTLTEWGFLILVGLMGLAMLVARGRKMF